MAGAAGHSVQGPTATSCRVRPGVPGTGRVLSARSRTAATAPGGARGMQVASISRCAALIGVSTQVLGRRCGLLARGAADVLGRDARDARPQESNMIALRQHNTGLQMALGMLPFCPMPATVPADHLGFLEAGDPNPRIRVPGRRLAMWDTRLRGRHRHRQTAAQCRSCSRRRSRCSVRHGHAAGWPRRAGQPAGP